MKLHPKVIAKLRQKLDNLHAKESSSGAIVHVEGELLPADSNLPVPLANGKPKFMDLATTQHYLANFINMTPAQICEFIDKQSDMLMMFSKNAALEWLAKAVETGDQNALDMYLKVIQASTVVAQEKASVKKVLGMGEEEVKPTHYVAPAYSKDEWEKTFQSGQPVSVQAAKDDSKQEQLYFGPTSKSVN